MIASALLLAGNLLLWWLCYYAPLALPTMISGTPINLHGLVLTLFLIAAYWLLFRRILKEDPETCCPIFLCKKASK